MSDDRVDPKRRRFLTRVTTGVGVAGVAAAATPFVLSMSPSDRAQAAGAPVEVDISRLRPGDMQTIEWRGRPVWVVRRTEAMLELLEEVRDQLADPDSDVAQQPEYARNPHRSIRPDVLVLVGLCTHLGCSPTARLRAGPAAGLGEGWPGGFFCACHGSRFDLAGRVFRDVPAPTNMEVPPHRFLDDNRILIGVDAEEGVA